MNVSTIRVRFAAASWLIVIPSTRETSRIPSSGRPPSRRAATRARRLEVAARCRPSRRRAAARARATATGDREAREAAPPSRRSRRPCSAASPPPSTRSTGSSASRSSSTARAQLLERDAVVGELGEQAQASLALLAVEAVEQALGLEVDLAHLAGRIHPLHTIRSWTAKRVELPIFELPLVLLPGELLPLHIFEERYKRMIDHCLEQGEPFGVVFRDSEGAPGGSAARRG